jgi:hypothetical protein
MRHTRPVSVLCLFSGMCPLFLPAPSAACMGAPLPQAPRPHPSPAPLDLQAPLKTQSTHGSWKAPSFLPGGCPACTAQHASAQDAQWHAVSAHKPSLELPGPQARPSRAPGAHRPAP